MGASITLAGESLIAQKQGAQQPLIVSRFVLANVPGLDPSGQVDRAAPKPAAHLVASYDVTQKGFVNPNQIVYSLMLGSDIGDFDWNWIGLETAEGVLLAVAYVPLQQKRKNIPPLQLGNNVTRNFLVVFDGAQALTGITIDAKTWQHDFTVRLHGIDERERLSNHDTFGRACFFSDGLKLTKVGNSYQVQPGTAYIEGVRVLVAATVAVAPPGFPAKAWLDVSLERQLSDVVARWEVRFGAALADFTDSAGVRHFCVPLADLPDSNSVADLRQAEPISDPLVKHFAGKKWVEGELDKKADKGTSLEDYNILNAIPNLNPLPGSSLDLHAGSFGFVTALEETHLCQNCYWNGADWVRHDEARAAVALIAGAGRVRVQRAGPGKNPIVWVSAFDVRDSGDTYSSTKIDQLIAAIDEAITKKANKGTKLADYGIDNAIPNVNPLPGNSLDIHGGTYAFLTSAVETNLAQNCYWDGTNWLRHDESKPCVTVFANAGNVYVRKAEAGPNPIAWTYSEKLRDSGDTYSKTNVDLFLDQLRQTLNQHHQWLIQIDAELKKKANKGTTLEEYGINNAIPNRNPLPEASLDIHGGSYSFLTAQRETHLAQNCYWNGSNWMRHDESRSAVVLIAGGGAVRVQRVAPGPNPILVFTETSEVIDSSKKALPGVAGIAPIANLEQLDAGADESSIVTPRTLRWGFSISLADNGYIAFPRWMGGLIIQWGNAYISNNGSQFLFPIGFPNKCFVLNMGTGEDTSGLAEVMNIVAGSRTRTGFIGNATAVSTYGYIAIGH
ncbi:hypothetical protein GIW54_01220 [Pseudomonas proteolytica]|uniref:Phage tail protein n=1 Tax=Pseudomonas proteolytica TaxID=219574 RepID=A0AAW5ADG6_9PSED|nr:phage tail protein [Pseudomonas proteolytica]MCF5059173.1 hypothetical protein [Pseudomonas proteolytica]MCF5099382.1 hypothetical protein [Pseudomonas proteolytica]